MRKIICFFKMKLCKHDFETEVKKTETKDSKGTYTKTVEIKTCKKCGGKTEHVENFFIIH